MIDVVGIGARGWETLAAPERTLLGSARRVFGSRRQLDLLPAMPGQQRMVWPTPLRPALVELLADHETSGALVLASGDPLLAGVGGTLVDLYGAASVRVHPGVSAEALARARMGWAADTVDVVRLIMPGADSIRRYLSPGRRLVILSRNGSSPTEVAAVLSEAGFGSSWLTVLSDLGSHREARHEAEARQWGAAEMPNLNVVCVSCSPDHASGSWSVGAGLPDELYEHDGQLTKREVRATALAHLMPVPGQLLWDVGAGGGSVGIEWMRAHPRCRTVAVERDPTRAQRVRANAARLGVPELVVVTGAAPEALEDLAQPDAVFIGGGASQQTIDSCWAALAPGGRLVVHAVTAETELLLHDGWRRLGGGLTRVSVELMEPIGRYSGWRPARAVVQWQVQKPWTAP